MVAVVVAPVFTINLSTFPCVMKNRIFLVGVLFWTAASTCVAQSIFSTEYESRADIRVFVVDYESRADLNVFKVDYASRAEGNEGLWFFEEYESRAQKKIYFVEYESRADLKIFFVDYASRAGWRNRSKMHLMY